MTNLVFISLIFVINVFLFIGDHSAKLWDAGRNELRWIRNFQNHSRSVRVVVFRPKDCSVFATGGRDGRILIWDTRCNNNVLTITKPENSINNGHPIIAPRTPGSSKRYYKPADGTNSVTALVFQDDNTLISCGSGDGNIRVWDLRRNYSCCKKDPLPKHSIPYYGSSSKNGYSNLILDESKLKLYANCMDHKIYCYNVGTYGVIPEQIYSGYNASFYIKSSLSPDGKYLISGSSDENAYIWNLKYSNPIIKLTGHSAEVTCAVWSHLEQTLIATCSDDNQHKIWTIGQESYNESERFGMTGRALEVELANRNNKPHWSMLEKTPKASKRKWVDSRDSSNKKSLRKSENDLWSDVRSQYKRKPKRNLFEMYSNSLAHINEETPGSSPKQLKFDSTSDPAPSTSTAYGNIYSDSETDLKTPDKFSCSKAILNSPSMYSSPTMNLPNFVSDGKAPHLRNFTPQKRKEVDWLTKLVRDKINGQSKIPKIENSEDSSKKVDQAKTDKTLLNFFNVIPATPNSPPLTDKTNDLDLGSKRKASESCEHVPVKRPNLGNESKSPTNKKLQERKSYKSLRTYFRSKTDFENKF